MASFFGRPAHEILGGCEQVSNMLVRMRVLASAIAVLSCKLTRQVLQSGFHGRTYRTEQTVSTQYDMTDKRTARYRVKGMEQFKKDYCTQVIGPATKAK